MLSPISGLPEIIIDKQNDVQIDINKNNRAKVDNVKLRQDSKKDSESTKTESKDKMYNQDSIDELNKELNSIMQGNKLNVEFKFEKEANQLIMKLIDDETKEVVRQVPADIMLRIARIVANSVGTGALADAKV